MERIEINYEIERKKLSTKLDMLVGKFAEIEDKERIKDEEKLAKKLEKQKNVQMLEDQKVLEVQQMIIDQGHKFGVLQSDFKDVLG